MTPPPHPRRISRKPPRDDAQPIVWAVYLGANTPAKLAAEWPGWTRTAAGYALQHAVKQGLIVRERLGHYATKHGGRFGCRNGAIAIHRAMLRDPCGRFAGMTDAPHRDPCRRFNHNDAKGCA